MHAAGVRLKPGMHTLLTLQRRAKGLLRCRIADIVGRIQSSTGAYWSRMPLNGMRKLRWRSPSATDSARLEQTAQARHAQGIHQHPIAHCILAK